MKMQVLIKVEEFHLGNWMWRFLKNTFGLSSKSHLQLLHFWTEEAEEASWIRGQMSSWEPFTSSCLNGTLQPCQILAYSATYPYITPQMSVFSIVFYRCTCGMSNFSENVKDHVWKSCKHFYVYKCIYNNNKTFFDSRFKASFFSSHNWQWPQWNNCLH